LPKGSLREQIIYPLKSSEFFAKGGKDEELENLMEMVDIIHVLKRESQGFESVREWKDVLSGGEKQRAAMARLYYYKPKFAILDECTSAVSLDVEGKLYSQAKGFGITLITVSHRAGLKKFHDYILKFKENSIEFSPMREEDLNEKEQIQENEIENENEAHKRT